MLNNVQKPLDNTPFFIRMETDFLIKRMYALIITKDFVTARKPQLFFSVKPNATVHPYFRAFFYFKNKPKHKNDG